MVRIVFITLFLLTSSELKSQSLDLNAVRSDFNKGVKDEILCEKYLKILEEQADDPTERGYAAAFHMFMAKHTSNPFKKMNFFKLGKNKLEQELASDPNNVELRFIRLSIQYHIPKYLGYHDDINDDKDFIVNNLYKLSDEFVKEQIYKYLKGANMYTTQELTMLGR